MPKYIFKCPICNKTAEGYMSFEKSEDGVPCKCGGTMDRAFSTDVCFVGINRFMRKPGGIDPKQDREDAAKSLEKRKHMKLHEGGIL